MGLALADDIADLIARTAGAGNSWQRTGFLAVAAGLEQIGGPGRYIHMERRSPQCAAGLVLTVILLAAPLNTAYPSDLQAGLAPVARQLDRMGDGLCHSLKLKCTRTHRSKKSTVRQGPSRTPKAARVSPKSPNTPALAPERDASSDATVKPVKTLIPIPRSKPDQIKAAVEAPPQKMVDPVAPDIPPSAAGADCLASLRSSKVEFDVVAAPDGSENCHVDVPVRLHTVETPSGKVSLPESPIFNCKFARQFSLWLSDTGAAIVFAQLNTKLVKVATGPGYECRGRNGDSSAKLSEHASGNAVDITTITTADGNAIQVSDAISPASPAFQVLRGLRTTACGYFSTVLGPGTNQSHASHFHFDMGLHGKSQNYRICE